MQRHQPIGLADSAWENEGASPFEAYAPEALEREADDDDDAYDLDEEVGDDDGDDGDDFSLEAALDGEEAFFDQESRGTDGPGLSAVARHQIARGLDMRARPKPWRSGIYGLVVHATGRGKMWQKAVKAGRSPLPELTAYYNRRNGPGYINGWGGVEARDLVQMADERVRTARGISMSAQVKSVRSGNWERDVPDILVRKWKARWPEVDSPLDLLPNRPGSRRWAHPNFAYLHVECIPCPSSRYGLAEPMRPGMLFSRAQHDAIAALAVDIAARHRWPADTAWWRTPRLLGHEDLTPISRSNRHGGWDPGYLKEPIWFDWDYVHEQIERRLGARSGSGASGVWGRITDAAADAAPGLSGAVAGVLERGEALMAVRRAIASGERDENRLTNIAFFALHPERDGRKIARHEHALAREWIELRDQVVRPALRSEAEVEAAYESLEAGFSAESGDPDGWNEGTWDEEASGNDQSWDEERPDDFDPSAAELQTDRYDDGELALYEADGEDPDDEAALFEAETGTANVDYNLALEHALTHLDPDYFAVPWLPEKRRSDGSWRRKGKFHTDDWEIGTDPTGYYKDKRGRRTEHRFGMLSLKPGRDPYDALIAIVDHPKRWSFDCATYVQALHLYALAKSRGRARITAYYADHPLRLRFFHSPGLRGLRYYRKNTQTGPWIEHKGGARREVHISDNALLSGVPTGSRVMWHNVKGKGSWINENTVKVGPNRYRGFPLFWGIFSVKGWKIQMGLAAHARDHTGTMLGRIQPASGLDVKNNPDLQALWQYTKKYVYLREVSVIGPNPRV